MIRMRFKKLFIIWALLICYLAFYGQDNETEEPVRKRREMPTWNFFLKFGSNFSKADISLQKTLIDLNYSAFEARGGLGYYLTPWANFRIEGGYGNIRGLNTQIGQSFKGSMIESAATMNLNFDKLIFTTSKHRFWGNIYGGVGLAAFKSIRYDYSLGSSTPIDSVGYDKRETAITFPVGVEMVYSATDNVDFHLGFRYTFTNTDSIDIINAGNNDGYVNLNFGMTYKIIPGQKKRSKPLVDAKPGNDDSLSINCVPEILVKENEMITYELIFDFPEKYLRKDEVLCMKTVLRYGDHEEFFVDAIQIGGENIDGADYWVAQDAKQIKISGRFAYKDSMKSSELYVIPYLYRHKGDTLPDCKEVNENTATLLPEYKVADGISLTKDRYRLIDQFKSTDSDIVVDVKEQTVNPFVLKFYQGSANVKYDYLYPDEDAILAAITERIKACNGNPIKYIITSYASPEGQERSNYLLTEKRSAKALSLLARTPVQYKVQFFVSMTYVALDDPKFYNIPDVSFYVHGGLYKYTTGSFKTSREAVKYCRQIWQLGFPNAFVAIFKVNSNDEIVMRNQDGILSSKEVERIVNMGADWEGLDQAMYEDKSIYANELRQRLVGTYGQKRQNILNQYYSERGKGLEIEVLSDMRKTEIEFKCMLGERYTGKSVSTGNVSILKQRYEMNPSRLSENELMYLAAQQAENNKKLEIYNFLLQMYPNNETARINKSAVYGNNGQFIEAERALNGIDYSNYGAFWYNKGLLALFNKDIEQAKEFFEKSKDAGMNTVAAERLLQIVDVNMVLTKIVLKNEDHCNYNTALLLMLYGEYEKANELLDCEEDIKGDVYYLKAIIAARQNEKEKVFLTLKQAIEKNDDYKQEAKRDVEFLKYRNDNEFMMIIN